jgi:hypothetical protein
MHLQPHSAFSELQQLHGQLMGLSEFVMTDRDIMRQLPTDALPVLARLDQLDMSEPWRKQVRASRELVEMAAAEAAKPLPQWSLVLAALNAALYPWAHIPQTPQQNRNNLQI